MHENKFNIVEGGVMSLEELGHEIGEITGMRVKRFEGMESRVVAQKPGTDQEFETFNIRFDFEESDDFVDVVFTADKKSRIEDYDFKKDRVKVQLMSYKRMDAPKENESSKVEE
ncbi:hypothetical protein [Salinicoccus carnicancri]|uniref:hypothetical protein n=1 Tax=Salinicoccus carnicancri TaxID=558170 RepID=UPI0002E96E89|nr:hypothetical protein [Salinicoccus carnicancri]